MQDVLVAIAEGRLKVLSNGTIQTRRAATKSKWKYAKAEIVGRGYMRITFGNSAGAFRCLVHRIVWFSSRQDVPPKMTLNHIDGDKSNNTLINLELATYSENMKHAIEIGLHNPRAPKKKHEGFCSKLTPDDVREIRKLGEAMTQVEIANCYGITRSHVSRILSGSCYSWLT